MTQTAAAVFQARPTLWSFDEHFQLDGANGFCCFGTLEADDRDMSCAVSSLVQVMCDPQCRTQYGFQSLVQKEWVMAGHRFHSRMNYHRDNDKEEVSVDASRQPLIST